MENIIREYLLKFAEENNWNKFDESKLSKCLVYIRSQAQLQAENGVACIPDTEVYSWAVHFFDEDGNVLEETKKIKKAIEKKEFEEETKKYLENVNSKPDVEIENVALKSTEKKVKKTKKAKKEEDTNQMSLFDLLG